MSTFSDWLINEIQLPYVATVGKTFLTMFLLNLVVYLGISSVSKGYSKKLSFLKLFQNKLKLARFSVDVYLMVYFSYQGFRVLNDFGGWKSFESMELGSGKIATVGKERAYLYRESAQTLCLHQAAYELKNLVDSIVYGDGIVFIVHHITTGLLAIFALHPFLHIYSSFFFGILQ